MVLVSSLNTKPLDSDLEQMARTDSIIYFFIFPNHSSINSPKQLWKSLISSSGFEEGACNSSALAVLHRGQNLPCLFFFRSGGSVSMHMDRDVSVRGAGIKMLSVTAWSVFGFICFQGGSFQIVKFDSQNIVPVEPNCEERACSLLIEYHFRI